MTRDEAIKILSRIWGGNPQHDLANSYADAFVALGMLKLDEPKSVQPPKVLSHIDCQIIMAKANNAIWGAQHGLAPQTIYDAFEKAGLHIVEK